MLTWKIQKIAGKTRVEFSDGEVREFSTKQKALEYINNRFFNTYF